MTAPLITFLSDYGLEDDFVGVCHGVIAGICPSARVIDLSHGVRRHDVRAGATILAQALPFMPVGVHLSVVDPEVGSQRRAVALRLADRRLLIGPDNGLLWLAARGGGGVEEAVDIGASPFRLEPVSATFHGRDIFAPVAAHLAAGAPLTQAGEPLGPDELVALELSEPRLDAGELIAHVRYVDRFGNLQLDARPENLAGSGLSLGRHVSLEAGGEVRQARYVGTFADVPRDGLILYEDAQRHLAVAVSHGDAAARLGLAIDDELRIVPV